MRIEKLKKSGWNGLAARSRGCVALGTLTALGAGPAHAASLDLTFNCKFPIVGFQNVQAHVEIPLPSQIEVGKPSGALPITTVSTINADTVQGMNLVGGKTLEGQGFSTAHIEAPATSLD